MKVSKTKIKGAYLIEMEPVSDFRGSFARQFCKNEFAKYGIDFNICQCNISKNPKAGTLRGMHYQKEPYPEIKMVSCTRGKIFDCIVDLRENSETYLKWEGFELGDNNNKMLYIPAGCAHGFQTLEDNSTVYYQLGEFFMPEHYSGVRWNDPKIGIEWPQTQNIIINDRDNSYELL